VALIHKSGGSALREFLPGVCDAQVAAVCSCVLLLGIQQGHHVFNVRLHSGDDTQQVQQDLPVLPHLCGVSHRAFRLGYSYDNRVRVGVASHLRGSARLPIALALVVCSGESETQAELQQPSGSV